MKLPLKNLVKLTLGGHFGFNDIKNYIVTIEIFTILIGEQKL